MIATIHWPVAILISALSSCLSVRIGTPGAPSTPQAQYRLEDLGNTRQRRPHAIASGLIIAPLRLNVVGESYSLVYSRSARQRSFYQYASWTDQPSYRLGQLTAERLEARGSFNSVALLGHGVSGQLMLNLAVDDLYHDVSSSPGTARLEVTAELVDRTNRMLVARRRFAERVPAAEANARAAVDALSRAAGRFLDEMVPWIEESAESWVAQHPPQSSSSAEP